MVILQKYRDGTFVVVEEQLLKTEIHAQHHHQYMVTHPSKLGLQLYKHSVLSLNRVEHTHISYGRDTRCCMLMW